MLKEILKQQIEDKIYYRSQLYMARWAIKNYYSNKSMDEINEEVGDILQLDEPFKSKEDMIQCVYDWIYENYNVSDDYIKIQADAELSTIMNEIDKNKKF